MINCIVREPSIERRGTHAAMEAEFREIDELGNWNAVYQEIRQQSSDLPCKIAKLPENRSRNRYRDVSPFDHSRIHLQIGNNDYINASLISVDEAQRNYILTQGPLPNTCGHFWEMVWEQRCRGVVMLNRVIEKGSVKCAQYWPQREEREADFEDTNFRLTLISEDVKSYYTVRELELENLLTQETREILHFHYTTWPDFGVPESPASFLNFLLKVRESGCLSPDHGPVVVHCSAGIGRSGTFCLVDTCLLLMSQREDPSSVRIQEVLLEMRRYRMGLIQTADQLRFSYLAVIEGAKYIMGDTSVQVSWKELSNEEDLPPEFTPPPRPRPPIDPPNGKDDLVNSDPTHFFTEIIKNSAEICANSAPQTFTDGPDLRRRMVAAGEVGATPLSSEQLDDPIVPREAPPKPARSPPKTPTAEAVPAPACGAWSPLMASVCMCTVLAAGAYVCYRTYFH
ncbi:tyrosine-protein phosphatase non-receptor type 1 isoform X2 [Rhinichthys klamathensis goyatoka]|uniref:tyrosine-protein phosphatase non-receptor type 1 isoform X2 n=2 Tax=Rhinichthys klamathensis goyatoka TaxID=3034132 RepID=UPI0024B5E2A2|nr:tyrosine-protein phosphatase non-receptor type 1 isoform X2 [Rhinichthys klamathensis goyatoka]